MNFCTLFSQVRLAAFVSLASFSFCTANAVSWEELSLINSALRLGSASGRSVGGATFKTRYARDCASLLAQHGDIAEVLEEVRLYTANLGKDPYLIGYLSGWLSSFSTEYRKVWKPCNQQLDSAVATALQARIEACRSSALEIGRDSPTFPVFELLKNNSYGLQVRQDMIGMLNFGNRNAAWKILLDGAGNQAFTLPCQAALTDGLIQALREKQ